MGPKEKRRGWKGGGGGGGEGGIEVGKGDWRRIGIWGWVGERRGRGKGGESGQIGDRKGRETAGEGEG